MPVSILLGRLSTGMATCYSFGYTPSDDPIARELAANVSRSAGLPGENENFGFIGWPSQEIANDWLWNHKNQTLIVFHLLPQTKISPIDNQPKLQSIHYLLQCNNTETTLFGIQMQLMSDFRQIGQCNRVCLLFVCAGTLFRPIIEAALPVQAALEREIRTCVQLEQSCC